MAEPISLTLSANGLNIEGDNSFTSLERQNTIEVLALEQTLTSSFERATLRPTGRRIYMPLRFTKRLDRSTPLLRKALAQNEVVEGNFRWFRPSPSGDGTTEHFLTLSFTQGRITKCVLRLPDTLGTETATSPPLEDVELTAGTYRWTWIDGGVEFEDTMSAST